MLTNFKVNAECSQTTGNYSLNSELYKNEIKKWKWISKQQWKQIFIWRTFSDTTTEEKQIGDCLSLACKSKNDFVYWEHYGGWNQTLANF